VTIAKLSLWFLELQQIQGTGVSAASPASARDANRSYADISTPQKLIVFHYRNKCQPLPSDSLFREGFEKPCLVLQ
jgi:hypothetical protein